MYDILENTKGMILHLQRLSTEDGPGIRTTVFFKGCPLRCQWCHNPESFSLKAQVQWLQNRCIGCESCIAACQVEGLVRRAEGISRDRALCTACGACVEACPSGAMEGLGAMVDVDSLVKELLKDRAYFEKSGGDPVLQPQFAAALMARLKESGVQVALDTCGLCSRQTLDLLLPQADIILYDLKLVDPVQHQRWTGAPNQVILDNLLYVGQMIKQHPEKTLWVRTPLIPGATATQENIQGVGAFLGNYMQAAVERWELCAFNNLCRDKYTRLGLDWPFACAPLMAQGELEQVGGWARDSGFDPSRIFVTGAARVDL
jgi:pyruvate formate lyase activating enzyme